MKKKNWEYIYIVSLNGEYNSCFSDYRAANNYVCEQLDKRDGDFWNTLRVPVKDLLRYFNQH